PEIIQELARGRHGRRMMVGDGVSDMATRTVVDLFVGFGGVVARQKVRDGADAFVDSASIAPILPLAVGPSGYARLAGTPHQAVFERGLALAQSGSLTLRTDELRNAFVKGFALS